MITTLKIRLEPNNKQMSLLFQSAGTARWAYNWTLARQEENYKNGKSFIQDGDLRRELTQLKKTKELQWLNNYSCDIPKQAIKDACKAYIRFFKGQANKPKFKSKRKARPTFYQDNFKVKFDNGKILLSKIGWINLSEKYRIPEDSQYSNIRITFNGVHWFVSIGVEIENTQPKLTNESLGIDVGLKDLAVCSNGKIYKNINKTHRVKKLEKKLKRLQREVAKKYIKNKKGESYRKTSNIIKLEKSIKKLYVRLDNIRTDYRHKITTEIVKTKPSRIVMETLNIKGMLKNKHLSKAIFKQGLYSFKAILQNKSNKMGIDFVEADKWFPSSKTCSKCGYIKPKLSLSERVFECECCKSSVDRDFNASVNLSRYTKFIKH